MVDGEDKLSAMGLFYKRHMDIILACMLILPLVIQIGRCFLRKKTEIKSINQPLLDKEQSSGKFEEMYSCHFTENSMTVKCATE